MTTSILDRVPVEQVSGRARAARPGVTLLRIVTGVLFCLGWLTARALGALWLAVAWAFAALTEGWAEGAKANKRQAAQRRAPG